MKLRLQPFNRNSTNYNLNAKEQGKQHIELQKQHPELARQALAHLRQARQATAVVELTPDATADAAHGPRPAPNPKQELAPNAV